MSSGQGVSTEGLVKQTARLRELHRLLVSSDQREDDFYQPYLDAGCRALEMPHGIVVRVGEEHCVVLATRHDGGLPLRSGDRLPLAGSFCAEVARRAEGLAHHRPVAVNERDATSQPLAAASCIGAPIPVRGQVFGTIRFSDTRERDRPFAPEDLEFVELIGQALGNLIERDQLERKRREAERVGAETVTLFQTAFTHAPIGMAMVGLDGRWLRVNPALCRHFGYTEAELLALDFQAVSYPDDLNRDLKLVRQLLKGTLREYQIEKRYMRKDGQPVWALLNVSLVRHEDGTPRYFVSQIQDIQEQKAMLAELERRRQQLEEANLKLAELATTDPLTGLLNRRALTEALEREIDRCRRQGTAVAVLMLDVDHFKAYNDRHGHRAGDAMLSAVAQRLKQSVRPYDVIARYGGEEFIVVFPGVGQQEVKAVGERVCSAVGDLSLDGDGVTVSVGVHASVPGDEETRVLVERMVDTADRALYRAKAQGRNRVEVV